jgi:ankyrin repeat protein
MKPPQIIIYQLADVVPPCVKEYINNKDGISDQLKDHLKSLWKKSDIVREHLFDLSTPIPDDIRDIIMNHDSNIPDDIASEMSTVYSNRNTPEEVSKYLKYLSYSSNNASDKKECENYIRKNSSSDRAFVDIYTNSEYDPIEGELEFLKSAFIVYSSQKILPTFINKIVKQRRDQLEKRVEDIQSLSDTEAQGDGQSERLEALLTFRDEDFEEVQNKLAGNIWLRTGPNCFVSTKCNAHRLARRAIYLLLGRKNDYLGIIALKLWDKHYSQFNSQMNERVCTKFIDYSQFHAINHKTLLYLAVKLGNLAIVQTFLNKLQRDFYFNYHDTQGSTPLHLAVELGHTAIVEAFLQDRRADPTRLNNNNHTPLHLAVELGHTAIVEAFLQDRRADPTRLDNNNHTPLHLAAELGHTAIVEAFLQDRRADPTRLNNNNHTPLQLAAKAGNIGATTKLLQDPRTREHLSRQPKKKGQTRQNNYYSLLNISHDTCKSLIRETFKTPIEIANIAEDFDLERQQKPTKEREKLPLLYHYVIKKPGAAELRYLLRRQCDPNYRLSNAHPCLLSEAVKCNNVEIVATLLQDARTNPNLADHRGWTALHYAAHSCDPTTPDIIDMLLRDRRANPTLQDKDGNTPLHIAAKEVLSKVVIFLMQDRRVQTTVNMANKKRDTALNLAVQGKRHSAIDAILKHGHQVAFAFNKNYIVPNYVNMHNPRDEVSYTHTLAALDTDHCPFNLIDIKKLTPLSTYMLVSYMRTNKQEDILVRGLPPSPYFIPAVIKEVNNDLDDIDSLLTFFLETIDEKDKKRYKEFRHYLVKERIAIINTLSDTLKLLPNDIIDVIFSYTSAKNPPNAENTLASVGQEALQKVQAKRKMIQATYVTQAPVRVGHNTLPKVQAKRKTTKMPTTHSENTYSCTSAETSPNAENTLASVGQEALPKVQAKRKATKMPATHSESTYSCTSAETSPNAENTLASVGQEALPKVQAKRKTTKMPAAHSENTVQPTEGNGIISEAQKDTGRHPNKHDDYRPSKRAEITVGALLGYITGLTISMINGIAFAESLLCYTSLIGLTAGLLVGCFLTYSGKTREDFTAEQLQLHRTNDPTTIIVQE